MFATKAYTLNAGQQEAYDGLVNAILRKDFVDIRQFLLNGYAGTGKTFVMNRIVEAVKEIAPYINFGMTAPTHKAVKVLKKNSELKDTLDFGTIHSFLGLKQVLIEQRDGSYKEEYKPDFNSRRRIDGIRVLIIDESSMLADELFEHLQNELRSNHNLIIIYMGDAFQIPPVGKKQETGESHSIPFIPARQEAHRIKVFNLTEPQRQAKESPIIMYSVAIREQHDRQKIDFEFTEEMKPYLEKIPSSTESLPYLRELFVKYFDTQAFQEDQDHVKVIAYTNKTVDWFNREIRLLLNKADTLPKIIENEKLILDEPLLDKDGKTILLHTNDEVITENVVVDEMEVKYKLFPATIMEEERLLKETGESVIKRILKIKIYRATLIADKGKHRVAIIHEDSAKDFEDVREMLKNHAKKSLNKFHTKDLWSQFYNIKKGLAWVKYNYAITAHKSQGSTYNYAISMEMDMEKSNFDIEERNRIRYVAGTRSRHKLYVVK